MKKFLLTEKDFKSNKCWIDLVKEQEYLLGSEEKGVQFVVNDLILFSHIDKALSGNFCVNFYSYIVLNKDNFHKHCNCSSDSLVDLNKWYDILILNLNKKHSILQRKFIQVPYANSLKLSYDINDEICTQAYLSCILISENMSLYQFNKFLDSDVIINMEHDLINFSINSRNYLNKNFNYFSL